MSDLLSASSIFLAVLGLLYSSWYSDIRESINIPIPTYKEDRKTVREHVEEIFYFRILPIAIGSSILTVIIIPNTVKIIIESFKIYYSLKFRGIINYSAVNTLFVAFFFFTAGFSLHTVKLTFKIRNKLKKILE